jgi:hypothetical protein
MFKYDLLCFWFVVAVVVAVVDLLSRVERDNYFGGVFFGTDIKKGNDYLFNLYLI